MADPARRNLPPLLAAAALLAFALYQGLATDHQRDFFIFRLGAELATRGASPYNVPLVRRHLAGQFPGTDAEEFVHNSGYFLPPAAVVLFLPFAVLPWGAAKVVWAVANGVGGYFIARLPLLLTAPRRSEPATAGPAVGEPVPVLLWAAVPFALLLNPIALAAVFVGQFSVVFVGCVAAGLLAFGRGKPYLAAALWAVPFVKPHLAIPLVPLAWFLGGWRPAAVVVLLVGVLNLAGAWVAGGSPLFLKDYLYYLPTAREAVAYNRVELNPTIASWNRLLFAAGGPLVELTAAGVLAGYAVWLGLLAGRCAAARTIPSPAWAAAAAAVGGVLCAQVLVYELIFLAVAVPWVRDLFASGWRVRGWLAVVLVVVEMVPRAVMANIGVGAHHPLGVALLAALVLAGPVAPRPQPPGG